MVNAVMLSVRKSVLDRKALGAGSRVVALSHSGRRAGSTLCGMITTSRPSVALHCHTLWAVIEAKLVEYVRQGAVPLRNDSECRTAGWPPRRRRCAVFLLAKGL